MPWPQDDHESSVDIGGAAGRNEPFDFRWEHALRPDFRCEYRTCSLECLDISGVVLRRVIQPPREYRVVCHVEGSSYERLRLPRKVIMLFKESSYSGNYLLHCQVPFLDSKCFGPAGFSYSNTEERSQCSQSLIAV